MENYIVRILRAYRFGCVDQVLQETQKPMWIAALTTAVVWFLLGLLFTTPSGNRFYRYIDGQRVVKGSEATPSLEQIRKWYSPLDLMSLLITRESPR